jgi:uncharacterized circularly permuted ATP-grasp superfamily protein
MDLVTSPTPYLFDQYPVMQNRHDEFFKTKDEIRASLQPIINFFNGLNINTYQQHHQAAITLFKEFGVTFGTSTENQATFPFDLIPRIISKHEWRHLARGIEQRTNALNAFLYDIYHQQHVLNNKIIPRALIETSSYYLPQLRQITPPGNIYIHISGIDIVHDKQGNYLVLEDNLRTPSGVSYALTNRTIMYHLFPQMMNDLSIEPIEDYPQQLSTLLKTLIDMTEKEVAVILTPGPLNAAYYEHTYLAQRMGWPLVQGHELFVENKKVYLKKFGKKKCVRIIYRRIEDSYLDPNMFNKDSLIGVPDLMQAYIAGNVVIANAPGNGVADDKATFAYVPQMIKYYLDEDPILSQVETYLCCDPKQKKAVLSNMKNLVVKMVNKSGGADILIGPQASEAEIKIYQARIQKNPRDFIAQPLIELSCCPTWNGEKMAPRRIDLRPFMISGKSSHWVMRGGVSRVALKENSYIVNSCQGGGSKDTWILKS